MKGTVLTAPSRDVSNMRVEKHGTLWKELLRRLGAGPLFGHVLVSLVDRAVRDTLGSLHSSVPLDSLAYSSVFSSWSLSVSLYPPSLSPSLPLSLAISVCLSVNIYLLLSI